MYTWDFNDLMKKRQELQEIRKNQRKSLSRKDLSRLEHSIDTYNFLLNFFKDNEYYSSFEEDIDDKTFRARYFNNIDRSINTKIIESCINAGKIIEKIDYSTSFDSNYLEVCSHDILEMTKDIFSSFNDSNVTSIVNNIINPSKHLLHVVDVENVLLLNANYSGYSCCDCFNNIGYVALFKNGKIRDLYTLVHEIFHVIIKQKSLPSYFIDDKSFIAEVEGAFSDLIVTDYLRKNKMYLDDIESIELLNYDNTRCFIRNLNISHNYSNIMDGNSFSINKINSKLKEDGYFYVVDEGIIRPILLSFCRDLNYSFSYLVALDLFYNYKNNPGNALKRLRKISKLNNDILNSFNGLGVTFINDGYSNLKDYQKIIKK